MSVRGGGADRPPGGADGSREPRQEPRRPRRRPLRRALAVVAGLLVLSLLAVAGAVLWAVRAPVPERDGQVALAGLTGDVTVLRDARGVPHVYADTSEDLFLAQGYVHAQDRFFEMDLRRRVTAGRLAELVGDDPAALEADVVVRTLGWRRTAEAELAGLDPATQRHLAAYAAGVDAYTAGRSPRELSLAYTVLGLQLPLAEVEPWDPVDSLAWLKALAWDLRSNYSAELGRGLLLADGLAPERVDQLYPPHPPEHPTIVREGEAEPVAAGLRGRAQPRHVPDDEAATVRGALVRTAEALDALAAAGATAPATGGLGSNSWVVAGEHTTSGAPLLANDPHLAPASPSTFHQVGLHCRVVSEVCPFDVTGFSFAGLPGVLIGQTSSVAWGLTTLYADHTDFVVERVVGDEQERDGELVPLQVRHETVRVAGGDPVDLRIREGANGPLLSDALVALDPLADAVEGAAEVGGGQVTAGREVEHAVALRWTATTPGTTMDALFAINAARSAADVVEAARLLDVPGQNIVVAETGVGGTIGYVTPGEVPVRARGDGTVPVPGWDSAYDWQEEVPRAALPVVLDPPRGWIATANNTVLPPRSEEAASVELGADTDLGYRARRIEDRLAALVERGGLTVEDMLALQLDTTSPLVDVLVPALLRATEGTAATDGDPLGEERALLAAWDGTQPVDGAAAAYAAAVWAELLRLTFHDELPEALHPDGGSRWVRVVEELLAGPDDPWWDDTATAAVETRDDVLAAAAAAASERLREELGEDPAAWRWGDLHVLSPQHTPLGGESVPGPVRSLFNLPERGVPGGISTVVAAQWHPARGFEVTAVPAMRMVVDLAERDASRWVDLTGVSGHPGDRHHGDQWDAWVAGETYPMPVTSSAVTEAASARLELVPAGR